MASKFVQLTENERLYSRQTIKFSIYDNGPRSIPLQEPLLLFYASHFPCHANTSNLRHAAGYSQCRCDGRQHTNGCLDCEFPKSLVLHGNNVLISHR